MEQEEFGKAEPSFPTRVRDVVEATAYYDLKSTTQRYFVTDGLHETDPQAHEERHSGRPYLKIDALLGKRRPREWSMAELAGALKNTSFPVEAPD